MDKLDLPAQEQCSCIRRGRLELLCNRPQNSVLRRQGDPKDSEGTQMELTLYSKKARAATRPEFLSTKLFSQKI